MNLLQHACLVAVYCLLQADSNTHAEPARKSIFDSINGPNPTQPPPYPYFPPRPNFVPHRPSLRSEFGTFQDFQAEGSTDPDSQESQDIQHNGDNFHDNTFKNGGYIVIETVAPENLKTNVGKASDILKTTPADVKREENVTIADARSSEKMSEVVVIDKSEETNQTVSDSDYNISTTAYTLNVDKLIKNSNDSRYADLDKDDTLFPDSSETKTNDKPEVTQPDETTEMDETISISNLTKDNSTDPDLSSTFGLEEAEYLLVPVANMNTPPVNLIEDKGNLGNGPQIFVNSPQTSPVNPQSQNNNQHMPNDRISTSTITVDPNSNVVGGQIPMNVQAFSFLNAASQVQPIAVNGVFDTNSVQLYLKQNNLPVNNNVPTSGNIPQTFPQNGQSLITSGNVQNQSPQIIATSELNNNQGLTNTILLNGGTPNNNEAYNFVPQTFTQNNPGFTNGVNLIPDNNLGNNVVTTNVQPGTNTIPNYNAGNIVPQVQGNFVPANNNQQLYTIVKVPNYQQSQNGDNNGNFVPIPNQQIQQFPNTNTYTLVPLRNLPNYGTNGQNNQFAINSNGIPTNQFNVGDVQVPLNNNQVLYSVNG